jgi:hypothetical protein
MVPASSALSSSVLHPEECYLQPVIRHFVSEYDGENQATSTKTVE